MWRFGGPIWRFGFVSGPPSTKKGTWRRRGEPGREDDDGAGLLKRRSLGEISPISVKTQRGGTAGAAPGPLWWFPVPGQEALGTNWKETGTWVILGGGLGGGKEPPRGHVLILIFFFSCFLSPFSERAAERLHLHPRVLHQERLPPRPPAEKPLQAPRHRAHIAKYGPGGGLGAPQFPPPPAPSLSRLPSARPPPGVLPRVCPF